MSPLAITTVDLARLQFATTSIYHFLFVPLTLGLGPLVAVMQTMWHRTRDERWLRLTRFFGTLFLINFAIGVATGLVQEFQFGMNWSVYSKFVGNIFGAPLAMEGLAAFMLEATFLGLWIFGWDRLSPRLHLATLWIAVSRLVDVGLLHPGRELVDATSGRLQARRRGGAAHQRLGALVQRVRAARVPAHDARRPDLRVDRDAGDLLLALPARQGRGPLHEGGEAGADRGGPGDVPPARGRQPLRRGRDERSEHEDRRLRGTVGHLPAVRFLAGPDRRVHRG